MTCLLMGKTIYLKKMYKLKKQGDKLEQLEEKRWASFLFKDIFIIKDGYYNKKPPLVSNKGDIPFLGASAFNNGITGFYDEHTILNYDKVGEVSKKNIDDRIFAGNCIAITNNGSVGNAYYQPKRFTCSHDVTPVYLKDKELNIYIALFLMPLIEKSGSGYQYANKWRPKRMRNSQIMLPVDEENNPDWNYMEFIIKNKITLLESRAPKINFHNISDNRGLDDVEWGEFSIEEIGTITAGKDIYQQERIPGNIPYITSTSVNNGIGYEVANSNNTLEKNCISVNRNGSVGYAFYHGYNALYSSDVRKLKVKNNNKYVSLFITTSIKKQKEKYSYGLKLGTARLKRQKIMLPVDTTGEPYWEFMEQYMKKLENKINKG